MWVALKALPVVILGGLTSVPGAIIGGLIIGVGEKLSEVYIGPMFGGGIEIWFAYVLALLFLLVGVFDALRILAQAYRGCFDDKLALGLVQLFR